jgi:CheY-like chemotaxis protein
MNGKIENVLLIDPSPTAAQELELVFYNNGYVANLEIAYNAWTGLNYIEQLVSMNKPLPNITFLDLHLPLIDGWGFLDRYKEKIPHDGSHEIYLLGDDYEVRDLIKSGVHPLIQGFLNKPVTDSEFIHILHDYNSRKAAMAS